VATVPKTGSFAILGSPEPALAGLVEQLAAELEGAGFEPAGDGAETSLVLNVVDPKEPRPFRRHSRGTFVAALWSRPELPAGVDLEPELWRGDAITAGIAEAVR